MTNARILIFKDKGIVALDANTNREVLAIAV